MKMLHKQQNMERKQLQNKMAQAIIKSNGASVSVAEHAEIVSNIKLKVSEALENTKASSHMEPELDAGRSEPILCDGHGHVFWKLNSYASGVDILLQGGSSYPVTPIQVLFCFKCSISYIYIYIFFAV